MILESHGSERVEGVFWDLWDVDLKGKVKVEIVEVELVVWVMVAGGG